MPLLTSLIKAVSIMYRNAETLTFDVARIYSTCTADLLNYVSSLIMPRGLYWRSDPGRYEFSRQTIWEMGTLESLDTNNPELLCYLRAANLLSLSFTWGNHEMPENLRYDHARKLCITYEDVGEAIIELPGDSFPSLVELAITLRFGHEVGAFVYGGLKLTSFQTLSCMTIVGSLFSPHETMLCLELLHQPDKCPALNEIRFRHGQPDWDTLFLMLEKRNFMQNRGISRIRTITLPFIPSELRAPLSLLLGGQYAERPPNKDLIIGGARELILDDKVLVLVIVLAYD